MTTHAVLQLHLSAANVVHLAEFACCLIYYAGFPAVSIVGTFSVGQCACVAVALASDKIRRSYISHQLSSEITLEQFPEIGVLVV